MSCNRSSCHCKGYKESESKWSKGTCHSCNHPQKDHKGTTTVIKSVITSTTNNYNFNRSAAVSVSSGSSNIYLNNSKRIPTYPTTQHQSSSNYNMSDKITVLYEDKWWNATIINVSTNQIEISYDDWDDSNEWINKVSKRIKKSSQIIISRNTSNSVSSVNPSYSVTSTTRNTSKSVSMLRQSFMKSQQNNHNSGSMKTAKKTCTVLINSQSLSTGDCAICADTKSNIVKLSKCGHELCKDCLKQYMKTAPDKLNIKCAFSYKCSELLDRYKDIKSVLSHKEFFEMYLSKNLKQCLSSGCNNTVSLFGTSAARLDCKQCNRSWCVNCKVSWHDGIDCETYKKQDMNEQKTKEAIANDSSMKACPRCGIMIQKNGGCNHMTCRSAGGCGYEFCWVCLGDYKTHGICY